MFLAFGSFSPKTNPVFKYNIIITLWLLPLARSCDCIEYFTFPCLSKFGWPYWEFGQGFNHFNFVCNHSFPWCTNHFCIHLKIYDLTDCISFMNVVSTIYFYYPLCNLNVAIFSMVVCSQLSPFGWPEGGIGELSPLTSESRVPVTVSSSFLSTSLGTGMLVPNNCFRVMIVFWFRLPNGLSKPYMLMLI